MFKRNRHEFTCPDVIYLRKRAWKNYYASLGVTLLSIGALNAWGYIQDKKLQRELAEMDD